MPIKTQWPELTDLYGLVAGIHTQPEAGRFQARVHLPVKVPAGTRFEVQAHPVGPTFGGQSHREAEEKAEAWACGYLRDAYGATFRVRRLARPAFGPEDFVGVAVGCQASAG